MAGTLTVTRDPRIAPNQGKAIEVISVAWTSDASGNATVSIPNLYGFLVKAQTVPSGAAAPTALYDITLLDANSIDCAQGKLVDRSATVSEEVYPLVSGGAIPVFLCGTHTFAVANAGNAKSGTCLLYVIEDL
jgi:hypothetical protein